MGKCKTSNKGGTNLQKGTFPFLSSQDEEEGDIVWYLIDETAAMEEVLWHSSSSPKTPFRFGRTSWLPSERLVSLSIDETIQLPPRMEDTIVFQ